MTGPGSITGDLRERMKRVFATQGFMRLLAPARGQALVARARVVKAGRTLTVCAADVFVEQDGNEEL